MAFHKNFKFSKGLILMTIDIAEIFIQINGICKKKLKLKLRTLTNFLVAPLKCLDFLGDRYLRLQLLTPPGVTLTPPPHFHFRGMGVVQGAKAGHFDAGPTF